MSEWKEYKIKQLGKIVTGKTPSTKDITLYGGHIPFICIPDLEKSKRVFVTNKSISNKGASTLKNLLIPPNSLVVSCIATIGKVGITSCTSLTNQQINSIIPDSSIVNTDFLYYLLKNQGEKIGIYGGGGSVFNIISKSKFSEIPLKIPDLPTQTAIAEILSSLDDKIELNNKINQELEDLAQTLFKRWFIDFEFPNENGDPYKSSGGEMVDSELGEIPKGWEVVKVSSLEYKLQTGSRPKGGVGGITSGLPSVGAESVKGLGYYDFSKVKFISKEFADKMKRGKVHGYELLIYKDGGKPGTFIPHFTMFGEGFPFDDFYINEHVFLLDFLNREFNCFCYFYFDSQYVIPIFENNGGKAAIPGINQEDVKQLCVFSPKNTLVKRFGEVAKSSIQTILQNCKENIQLTTLRDTLLPKLISGELEVSQIQNLP